MWTKDARFNIFKLASYFSFIDVAKDTVWDGGKFFNEQLVSRDGGKTYILERNQILFGCFFFLSDERMAHSRDAYNILKLLAAFGALYSMIFSSLEGVGKFINSKIIRAKFIRALYFVETDDAHKHDHDHEG